MLAMNLPLAILMAGNILAFQSVAAGDAASPRLTLDAKKIPPRMATPPIVAGPQDGFVDVTSKSGIQFVHQFNHHRIANILLSNGSGGAVFDYDNDGWMDIYLVNWGTLPGVTASSASGIKREPNRLYHNLKNGTFEDVTMKAGVAGFGYVHAAVAGDIDKDGFSDLLVVNAGQCLLYRNRGDGTFEDVTAKAGINSKGTGISAVFFDAGRDGWLDIFIANYLTYIPEKESEQNPGAYPGPLAYEGQANVYYHNRGDGTFEDLTKQAGLYAPGHRAMAVSAFDANGDGAADLYVCNDDTPNALWLNDGKGSFHESAIEKGVAFNSIGEAPGSMNAAIGDVNNDGLPDFYITRLGYGSLYLRNAKGFYDDRMWASGLGLLTQNYVAWGGVFIDFDNDSDLDLMVANGDAFTIEGTKSLLLENNGNAKFSDASAKGGNYFNQKINGRGNAVLDFDNDGRLDLLITALADRPFLLQNQFTNANHWLKLDLKGTRSNRNGYGAKVKLTADKLILTAEALCPTGFLMQSDPRLHFGLGAQPMVDSLEVRWPSGRLQVLKNIPANQILKIIEPNL
jgi:hypothetical protein